MTSIALFWWVSLTILNQQVFPWRHQRWWNLFWVNFQRCWRFLAAQKRWGYRGRILVEWMLNFSHFYYYSLLKLSNNLKWPDDCFTDSKAISKEWRFMLLKSQILNDLAKYTLELWPMIHEDQLATNILRISPFLKLALTHPNRGPISAQDAAPCGRASWNTAMGQTNGCCHKAAGTVPEIPEKPSLRLLEHGNFM